VQLIAAMANTSTLQQYRDANKISLAAFASKFGINKSTAMRWQKRVPADRVQDVSDITGIPPHELRPDVFRAPQAEDAA